MIIINYAPLQIEFLNFMTILQKKMHDVTTKNRIIKFYYNINSR